MDHENVRPDLVILGKALSGGVYPVSYENNMLSSLVKISPLLWLHNKLHLSDQKTIQVKWFGISLVFKK